MEDIEGDDRAKTGGLEQDPCPAQDDGAAAFAKGAAKALPLHPEIEWGPLPDGRFRFTDNPSAEELRAYAEWDPNIKEEVEEKFLDLARRRARDDAIRDVYRRVLPEPPDLPRVAAPTTREETAHALARLVADTQEAVDYLLALGRNRHNDVGQRIRALSAVTRIGPAAAKIGERIDALLRPPAAARGRGRARGERRP